MAKSRVFVVQEGAHDYSAAEEFGELQFLSSAEITSTDIQVSERNRGIIDEMRRRLRASYIPGNDYVLLTGSPVAIAWVVMLLATFDAPFHRVLKWDAQQRAYLPYNIYRDL